MHFGKAVVAIILFCAALSSFAQCEASAAFKSDEEFGRWMTYYYTKPDPLMVPSAIRYFSGSAIIRSKGAMPVMSFFAAIFRKDPALMDKAFDEIALDGSENAKAAIIDILSLSVTVPAGSLIEKARQQWPSKPLQDLIAGRQRRPFPDLLKAPVNSPLAMDMLWGAFFATGDAKPVQQIISVIALAKRGDREDLILGNAAIWSLTSNAGQHPLVMQICRQELKHAQGTQKILLEQIINGKP